MEDGFTVGRGVDNVVFSCPKAQCEDTGFDLISIGKSARQNFEQIEGPSYRAARNEELHTNKKGTCPR